MVIKKRWKQEKEGKLIIDKGSGTVKLKVQIFCRLLLVSERGFFCATIGLSRVCPLLPDSGKFRYFALKSVKKIFFGEGIW